MNASLKSAIAQVRRDCAHLELSDEEVLGMAENDLADQRQTEPQDLAEWLHLGSVM